MINMPVLITDGLLLSAVIGVIVAVSFIYRPRIWLREFPDDIAEMAEPMTDAETALALKVGLSVLGVMLIGISASTVRYGFENGFWLAVLHAYLVFQIFNVVDVLIDWAALAIIDAANPPIPGTENAPGWNNYAYHAVAGLKGSVIGIPLALLATGTGWLVSAYVL